MTIEYTCVAQAVTLTATLTATLTVTLTATLTVTLTVTVSPCVPSDRYRKMQKMGLPEGAVRNKMTKDGLSQVNGYLFQRISLSNPENPETRKPEPKPERKLSP
jgi:hypothetical protein